MRKVNCLNCGGLAWPAWPDFERGVRRPSGQMNLGNFQYAAQIGLVFDSAPDLGYNKKRKDKICAIAAAVKRSQNPTSNRL
ncbi:MAG: hypothetical protein COV72_04705 [Candidatus Omnitrophica bacterium CG11_big_fil_rev_8_21_14_0_20_42_13]|uniref:Uncharacterized protein n=1 Tax=Candidatus Ghiorseimicrobium undicola TaxID=1974746 RepID=A0A2H0LXG5_9BACT|nr:MAG: hypothetical protein COV72_04705 [Candidatus Omnitrophica bacterium CG11_big_fil_rev_8_21_14_0_20_42_13]